MNDNPTPWQAFPDVGFELAEIQNGDAWERNGRKQPGHYPRCRICNLPIKNEERAVWVREHFGGGWIVTESEGDQISAAGFASWDLGGQPIGPECYRKHKEKLAPFVGAAAT